jgi:hypothetical protein
MTANCTPTADLPNPCTSLAFLPPAAASQVEISRYLFWATFAVRSSYFHVRHRVWRVVSLGFLVGLDSIIPRWSATHPNIWNSPSSCYLHAIEVLFRIEIDRLRDSLSADWALYRTFPFRQCFKVCPFDTYHNVLVDAVTDFLQLFPYTDLVKL